MDDALLGVSYERLDLGFECLTAVSDQNKPTLGHRAIYGADGEVYIEYELPSSMNVDIQLFDIMGRKVAQLENGSKFSGKHQVAIRVNAGHLANGQYIYRIYANREVFSRSVILTR